VIPPPEPELPDPKPSDPAAHDPDPPQPLSSEEESPQAASSPAEAPSAEDHGAEPEPPSEPEPDLLEPRAPRPSRPATSGAKARSSAACDEARAGMRAFVAGPASAQAVTEPVHVSRLASGSGQCGQTYLPPGADRTFRTYLFGRTTVRFHNPGPGWVGVQWWSSTSYASFDVAPGATVDLTRSFAGFNISVHIWRDTGVYVTFPIGPC
jgi:hypothetical protein